MSNNWEYKNKALESLKAARILFEAECYNSCVSRCYYAMFQMAITALVKFGIRPPRRREYEHAWVQASFAREFIHRKKSLPSGMAGLLSEVIEFRHEADYWETSFGRKRTGRVLRKASDFVKAVQEVLT